MKLVTVALVQMASKLGDISANADAMRAWIGRAAEAGADFVLFPECSLSGYSMDSRELVGMRGYANNSLTPGAYNNSNQGGDMFTKYTLELRYPLSLNPQATIYALTFLEAGNCWLGFKDFNPFDVKRSAGLGVRIYLPMFGLLGLDWGYGFDDVYGTTGNNHSQFHFSIGGSID